MSEEVNKPVRKYEVTASFRDGVVSWTFGVMTDDNQIHVLPVRDGEEIPVLLDLCRRDWTIYFNSQTKTISSGWNIPGSKESATFR